MQVPAPAGNMSLSVDRSVSLRAPAKVNLSLVVLGARPDGYHDLHSVMATVSLYDDLRLALSEQPGIAFHTSGLGVPSGRDNLVVRAAEAMARRAGVEPALRIDLHKRIPPGGGLGGGSSDAAACLWGLNQLWQLGYSRPELASLAAELGSDVAFFLYGPVALCTGRGEIVKPLAQRCGRHVLLVMPAVQVSTALVYKHFQYKRGQADDLLRQVRYFLRRGDLDGLAAQGINNLSRPCLNLFPSLDDLRVGLEELGVAPVQISGSGASLFATSCSLNQVKHWAQLVQDRQLGQAQGISFHYQSEPFLEVPHADF